MNENENILPSNLRVLILEDSSPFRTVLKVQLKKMGITSPVMECVDTQSVYEELKKEKSLEEQYQLIICDWVLPDGTGLDVLKFIKNEEHLKGIPVVMLTAHGDTDRMLDAVSEGISAYLSKPWTYSDLTVLLSKVWKKNLVIL